MALVDLIDWIETFGREGATWYVKRLAANDTLASGGHQAGPYFPKEFLFDVFPELNKPAFKNPDIRFPLYIDSHISNLSDRDIRAVWYNNKLHGGTRNETRLTGFGGQNSALLDPDSTGALVVFAFIQIQGGRTSECHVWVCDDEVQSDLFEERLGPVEPGQYIVWKPGILSAQTDLFATGPVPHGSCWLTREQMPDNWLVKFPTGREIIEKTIGLRPPTAMTPDERLIRRRDCEFEIFRSVEQEFYGDKISKGFQNMESFVSLANTILQSRKSRSGKSLEYHTIEILKEECFIQDVHFVWNVNIDGKRPDFLFPTVEAYRDHSFDTTSLRMLAAKTTCKDRWRQIRNEVDRDRIPTLHLLTLQEGVSENQFNEMLDEGIQLVVPTKLHKSYPKEIRELLWSLEDFLTDIRSLSI